MDSIKRKTTRSKFYFIMGLVGLLAIFIGFSRPFIIPVSRGSFKAPATIYVHAFFSFSWVLLFTLQAYLIRSRKPKIHIRLGLLGIIIALGAAFSLIPVAKFIMERDLQLGMGDTAFSNSVGLLTTGVVFLILVGFGLYYRRKPQVHKRLLLLATIVLLWPAWFRFRHFFPSVPRPDIWFGLILADSLIIIAWLWDKVQHKKIHPVFLYAGIAIIMEQVFEVYMYDSMLWREMGKVLYRAF